MGNPAAAAITHVLHNKQEFPLATTLDDILLLSIASTTSTSTTAAWNTPMPAETRSPSPRELARVTAVGSNYVHIQAASTAAGEMMSQRSVEAALFSGRRMSERTNSEKVDDVAAELVKEYERRRRRCSTMMLPNVVIKQVTTRAVDVVGDHVVVREHGEVGVVNAGVDVIVRLPPIAEDLK
uniref:Uncharacterized protein n=1 Tax=Leersia perrieri TaxID=77586 RepID=A0A0D9XSK0_9ORYZ